MDYFNWQRMKENKELFEANPNELNIEIDHSDIEAANEDKCMTDAYSSIYLY